MAGNDSARGLPNKVLLVGPHPPPFGGARVSFQLLLDELTVLGRPVVSVVNAPVRKWPPENGKSPVHHRKTLEVVLRSLKTLRQVDAVWVFCSPRFGLSYGLLYLIACRFAGVPAAIRFFGGHPYLQAKRIWRPLRSCVNTVLGFAQRIIVQTEVGRREFPSSLQGRLQVVHGYRRPSVETVRKLSPTNNRRTVKFYYAGLISRDKGSFLLVDAFKLADQMLSGSEPKIELHLFGVDAEGVESYMEGTERIYYHGAIDHEALLRRLEQFDILAFPSMYRNEGHSGTVIEAMMAGKPVICFDLPGLLELVMDDVNGLVVQGCSTDRFAAAIVRASRDSGLRRRLSASALTESKKFDTKVAIPKLLAALSG
jgi:glycosyltransferase involved in cell wall biosynthesis